MIYTYLDLRFSSCLRQNITLKEILIMKNLFLVSFLLLSVLKIQAQNSLFDELEKDLVLSESKKVTAIFKSYKVLNLDTPKLVSKKHLNFVVAHRFETIKNGFEDLFGLDTANTRLSFTYGLTDAINVSFARSRFGNPYSFGVKYNIAHQQKNGFPVTIAGLNQLGINDELSRSSLPRLSFENRLTSNHQLIIARKFNSKLSLELVPTVLHDGLVIEDNQDNWQGALGFGGRYLFTKRMGLVVDYVAHLNRASNSTFNNPLSIGLEIETGGHVFQLSFSNANGLYENNFINGATGDWLDGDIFFGFSINRIFNFNKK